MIFAFIDESGHPHPNDQASRPVLVTVCCDAKYLRTINTELFKLKRRILNIGVDARAVTVRTMAMTPIMSMNSGTPHLVDQAVRVSNW